MFEGLQVAAGRVGFEIAAHTTLHRDADATLVTTARTLATIRVAPDHVAVGFQPPLRFVVHSPPFGALVEDVVWHRAIYRFGGGVTVETERVPAWLAFDLATTRVRSTLERTIGELFAGSAFARPGYDPFRDPDVVQNVQSLQSRFSGGGSSMSAVPMPRLVSATVSVAVTQGVVQRRDDAVIRLAPGTRVVVDAVLSGGPTETRLVTISEARVRLDPPLQIESGANLIGLNGFAVLSGTCGPTIRVEPHDLRIERASRGASTLVLVGALFGLVAGLRAGGGSEIQGVMEGAAHGAAVLDAIVAGQLSRQFTAAAVIALEQARPRLKEAAPLVDWDALWCDRSGRPVLDRPLSRQ